MDGWMEEGREGWMAVRWAVLCTGRCLLLFAQSRGIRCHDSRPEPEAVEKNYDESSFPPVVIQCLTERAFFSDK